MQCPLAAARARQLCASRHARLRACAAERRLRRPFGRDVVRTARRLCAAEACHRCKPVRYHGPPPPARDKQTLACQSTRAGPCLELPLTSEVRTSRGHDSDLLTAPASVPRHRPLCLWCAYRRQQIRQAIQ